MTVNFVQTTKFPYYLSSVFELASPLLPPLQKHYVLFIVISMTHINKKLYTRLSSSGGDILIFLKHKKPIKKLNSIQLQ